MQISRIAVLLLLATTAAPIHVSAADARSQLPGDPVAERILRQAREALAKFDRVEIDCQWSDLDNQHQTEVCYRTHFYMVNSAGYLFEIRPLDLTGKTARARTKSGRLFRLKSRPPETSLYANGALTEIDDHNHTYEIRKYEPQPGDPLGDIESPRAFSGVVIPHALHCASDWNKVRANFRIEQFASTATTIGISLTPRSHENWDQTVEKGIVVTGDAPLEPHLLTPDFIKEVMGDYRLAPNREEIVLQRSTLQPKSWRRIHGDSDSLITFECFDLNPAPRPLKVSLAGYRGKSRTIRRYNFTVSDKDSEARAAAKSTLILDEDDLEAEALLIETTYCLVRLARLF
jgi:hypothetical protein